MDPSLIFLRYTRLTSYLSSSTMLIAAALSWLVIQYHCVRFGDCEVVQESLLLVARV